MWQHDSSNNKRPKPRNKGSKYTEQLIEIKRRRRRRYHPGDVGAIEYSVCLSVGGGGGVCRKFTAIGWL